MARRRYEAYRDSGVEWLGEVPAQWMVQRLNRSVHRRDEKTEGDPESPIPYVGLEHVESWTGHIIGLDDELVPEGLSNCFRTGDVLLGKLRPYLAKGFVAEFDGICSAEFLVMRPTAYHARFLLYLLLSEGFVDEVDSSTYGAKMP